MSNKIDLSKLTFLIPIRIDSDDRIRNIITVLCYLLKNFNTNIILKEVDNEKYFQSYALPQIKEFVEDDINQLDYIFEKSNDPVFYRMQIINEMLERSKTEVIVNYDCDVLLKPDTYIKCYNLIIDKTYDVIYPYGFGYYQKQIYANDELVSEFLNNNFNFSILEQQQNTEISQYGHVQFFNRRVYIEGGMENENFRGSSPEDKERFFRFNKLGYNVGRIDDHVYHLEHSRGDNSWPVSYQKNPYMKENLELWDFLQRLDKKQLINYYTSQKYLRKYSEE